MLESVGAGQTLLADRAYDSDALREALAARGATANVKPMPNRVNIPKFSERLYKNETLLKGSLTSSSTTERLQRASKSTTLISSRL